MKLNHSVLKGVIFIAFGCLAPALVRGAPPAHRTPASGASVLYAKNGFTISSEKALAAAVKSLKGSKYFYSKAEAAYIWDLNGGIIDGKNQSGNGGQSEKQEPLIRVKLPLIMENGFIRNNKDALTFFSKNSGVIQMTWLNVGEDAVATFSGAVNFTARECEAINRAGGDKSFQFNEAKGLVAEDNLIYSGTTGMRIGASDVTDVTEVAYVSNNRFVGVDTAYHLSKITVKERSASRYETVRLHWKHSNGSKLIPIGSP